jgi:hypothetical protein
MLNRILPTRQQWYQLRLKQFNTDFTQCGATYSRSSLDYLINLSNKTLDKFFTLTVQISNRANLNTRGRIKNRFGSAEEEDSAIIEGNGEN